MSHEHHHHDEHEGCKCHEHHHHEHHHHEHHHEHEGCGCHEHEGCGCHHHHHHEGSQRAKLATIIVAALLLAVAVIIEKRCSLPTWQLLLVYLVPYLLVGFETLKEAAEGLLHGEPLNENFLMTVATIGALAIGFMPGAETQFPEAVFVMLFFQVGELFEGYAEGKSRKSIAHLMNIRPEVVHVTSPNPSKGGGQDTFVEDVSPEEVAVGSTILIKPGERVPLDGIVVEGKTSLNTVALTGETLPRNIVEGDEVVSGCVNLSGVVKVRTTKSYGESTVAKIINLVEHAADHKSKSEAFITRFARVYTPIVVALAVLLAVIPILITAFGGTLSPAFGGIRGGIYRALLFLVVSCPCALVLSIPLTFFAGIGGASRKGILIKGANFMDSLSKVKTMVFDKTGTLTYGQFEVTAVHPDYSKSEDSSRYEVRDARYENGFSGSEERELLHLAAHVEHYSTHPIAEALRNAFPEEATDGCEVSDVEEIAGQGIRARVGDKIVCVGNTKMMETIGVEWHDCHHVGTIIHVAIEDTTSHPRTSAPSHPRLSYAGHVVINDKVKEESGQAIAQLKRQGVERIVMLTGDRKEVAASVARELNINEYHAELLPADKLEFLENYMRSEEREETSKIAFVGDGINDAPVLARADVGIAMGGLGSDAAIEAADVVLMDDNPSKIATAISIARRTLSIARQNVVFAIGVKVAVLLLALFGLATMWMAVFADVGVTVLAVLNAMRALRA
ncbi:MAG: heavy metal translocating P-type ATPase [Prevotella sp.]|nr:heavy metal translocating P-type ATPase [Prevotella sp.]